MDTEYVVTLKENVPAMTAVAVNNSGIIGVTDFINYGILIAVGLQILHTLWKFRKDILEHREEKDVR